MTHGTPSSESAALAAALLGAYAKRVASRVGDLSPGAGFDGLAEAIAEGERWLAAELDGLLSQPYPRQARAPLEVFQEAMRFPTAALEAAGVPPVDRDPIAEAALPEDAYLLAPASSQELGDEVWHAHLAWGAAKARAMVRPALALLSTDLMDRSRIEPVVTAAGFDLVVWSSEDSVAGLERYPSRAFVDLVHPDADAVMRLLAAAGVRVTAFGPHVDDLAMVRARSLGAADALPRSRFFRILPELLPTLT